MSPETSAENRVRRISAVFHRPDLKKKLFFFVSGAVISIPFTIFVESSTRLFFGFGLPEFLANFFSIAILAPIVEEFAKAYPLFYRRGETGKSILTLGFLVGSGFGIVEFLLYVFFYQASVLLRLPALLFHATNASITAYGIVTKQVLLFFATAVLLHFLNNFSALLGPLWLIGGVSAIAASYLLSWRLYRRASEKIIDQ